jgi:hypothetical protein
MMRTVLILAAGQSKRWRDGTWPERGPKQLLDIGGETLIARVVRQVRARGFEPTVITHDAAIAAAVSGAAVYAPQDHRWLASSLWSANPLWRGQVAVLFSDVLYSRELLNFILSETRSPVFYGRWGEIYGFAFDDRDRSMTACTQAVLDDANAAAEDEYDVGRAWQLYRWWAGEDLHTHTGPTQSSDLFYLVPDADYTCDIDTAKDWEAARRNVLSRLDDQLERVR